MSNLLAVPFKHSSAIDIKDPVKNYIQNNSGTHPDEFKSDIARWQTFRRDALGTAVHVNAVDPILLSVTNSSHLPPLIDLSNSYHAQLLFILSKLPTDVRLHDPVAPRANHIIPS